MNSMKSMKLTGSETDQTMPVASGESKAPAYPWGLRIELNDESMKKLGIDELPEVGETLDLMAKVTVERVSQNDTKEGGKRQDMSLQITDMSLCECQDKDEEMPTDKKLYQTNGQEYKPKTGKTILVDL